MKEPLKIIDRILIDRKLFAEGKFDPERVVKEKVSLGFNAEHFSIILKGRIKRLSHISTLKKVLPDYLKFAHEYGLKVFIYINVHWHDLGDLEEHPDWFQVDYNGNVITNVYGRGLMPCVNSPGWRNYSLNLIEEVARMGPHGIFLDGPVFHPRGCYCEYCVTKFTSKYGFKPPKKGDLLNKFHAKLVEFQQDSLTEYMKETYERVKNVRKDILIYLNGEPLRPNWASGRDNVKLAKYQDLVGAEGGFEYYNLLESPFFKCSMTAKLLEAQAPSKPRVIFIAAKHSPWNREVLTPAELKLRCAETLANGAYYWIGYTYESKELEVAMKEINSWMDGNEDYFTNTSNIARVGLYWSQLTANIYGGEVPTSDFTGRTIKFMRDYMKSFLGAYELLTRIRIPFRIVINPEQLKGLDLLVLPNVACMTSDEVKAIKDFIKRGGKLIASFESSLYSPDGEKLANFELSEVFGVEYLGIEEYGTYENYMISDTVSLPAYTYAIKVKVINGKAANYLTENTRGWYQPIMTSKYPGIIENNYGNGISVYLAGNFFQVFSNYRFSSYMKYFNNLIDRLITKEVLVKGAPFSIEVVLRGKGSLKEVHLVNFTSELMRPIHNIAPLRSLIIKLPGIKEVSAVKNLINDTARLSWNVREDGLVIELSELKEYEVVVIE